MKIAGTLRQRLGISQECLAQLIGGKRSTLALAEKGKRPIPTYPVLKLLPLLELETNLPASPLTEPSEAPGEDCLRQCALHALACRHKASTLRQQLAIAEERRQQAFRLLQFCDALWQCEPPTTKTKRWIEQQRYEAEKRKQHYSSGKILLLKLQLEALEKEAEIYEGVNK